MAKVVYVCSALKGDIKNNKKKAAIYSRKVMELGYIPYTPHLMFTYFINEDIREEREHALQMGLEMLPYCNELWIFGYRITEGMAAEIRRARQLGIPVYYKNVKILDIRIAERRKQAVKKAA